jgi:fibronectin-binding autotransporter adhesin
LVSLFRIGAFGFATLFALTACGGGGGTSVFGGASTSPGTSGAVGGNAKVQFTFTYSTSSASTSSSARAIVASAVRKPATISPDTQSLTVSVNGGTPQIFNAAPPTCTNNGTTVSCTLSIGAPLGVDSFLILTYSGPNGTGSVLNAAAVTLNVSQSGPNTASATAGAALTVNSLADGSGGSYSCASGSTTCTVREAVAEASTTAGTYTALLFSGVTSVTVGSPVTINGQNIIIIGPGALVANTSGSGAPSASGNLKISGGGTTQIFHVTSGSLAVDGITLTDGVAPATCVGQSGYSCGGAIESYGTLSIVNTVLSANGNTSINYGGAVYDQSQVGSTTAVAYSTFTGNAGQNGGGYYLEYYAPGSGGAAFSHCVFANNTASDGSVYGHGGAIYAAWNLSVDSSIFTGNVAGSASVSGFNGHGGAIDLAYDGQSPTITNSTFGGTSASAGNFAGGAGYNDTGFGGAIANEANYPLILGGDTFANNVSRGGYDAEGGAIADYQGITSTGDTFTSNVADASAGNSSESGYAGGGAVYTDYNTTWTNDTFTSNQAKGGLATNGAYNSEAYGGAIYSDSGDPAQITASQTTFSTNVASASYLCYGGGVYVDWDAPTPAVPFTNVQFTGNSCTAINNTSSAYAEGGGLYVYYGPISLETVTFTNNSVSAQYTPSDTEETAIAGGGGLEYASGYCSDECDESLKRRSPGPNSAKVRAHLLALEMRHANPNSKHKVPGLSHSRAPMATRSVQSTPSDGIDVSTFTGNSASATALAAYAYGGGADISGQASVTNTTFTGNKALWVGTGFEGSASGGGISLCGDSAGGNITITATLSGNTATNSGGGVYNNNCTETTILNSTISGNSVSSVHLPGDGGGGVYNTPYGYELLISGSTLTGNSVSGSYADSGGGGFANYGGSAMFLNSTIYNNSSSIDGGGVENFDEAETILTNATVYQNSATGNGGGISNDPYTSGTGKTFVYIANTIVAGDTGSANGSDIWNLDTLTSQGYNLVQQGSNYGSGSSNAPQTGDIIGVGPALASALASNGGPTQTIADTSSSPGKAHIPFANSMCGIWGTNVDQRGYARGAGVVCDVGAYEFSGTATAQSLAAKSLRNGLSFLRKTH